MTAIVAGTASAFLLLASATLGGDGKADERAAWRIDPARTHVGFIIDAVGFPRTQGEFRVFDGRLSIDLEHPSLSRVAFTVSADSIDVGSASFDDTLRGPAFLNIQRFPEIRFQSTHVEKRDDASVALTGDLTLLGVTQPLEVDVAVQRVGGGRLAFVARAHIDRLAFGMNSGFPIISRDIDLTVSSEAVGG